MRTIVLRTLSLTAVAATAVLASTTASADRISAGGNSHGAVTQIGAGVKELSIESMFVLSRTGLAETKDGAKDDQTVTRLSVVGTPAFRYFVADDFAITIEAGGYLESERTKVGSNDAAKQQTVGFLGTLGVAYYASLGGGMFLAPSVGAGAFVGSTETDVTTGTGTHTLDATRAGLLLRGGIGLVFYPSARFNLFARPEVVSFIGSHKPKDDAHTAAAGVSTDSRNFTSIQGGFTVGASYVF